MKNKIYKTDNGLTMVKCEPLNFQRQSVYAGDTGEPYFYHIYVGGFGSGHICNYDDKKKLLSIAFSFYSSNDPSLKFKVKSLEEASEIVSKLAKGMNVSLKDTIYLD